MCLYFLNLSFFVVQLTKRKSSLKLLKDAILLKIVICDDEQSYVDTISANIQCYCESHHVRYEICSFTDCSDIFKRNKKYDMAFLDVKMTPISGIELARHLIEINPKIIIFMITSYNQYLDEAMDLHVFRFIEKPLDIFRLFSGMDKAIELLKQTTVSFFLSEKDKIVRIYSDDIIYIEIVKRHTQIITPKSKYISNNSIEYWYNHLPKSTFYKVHSSFIINMNYITQYNRDLVTLNNEYTVPIAYRKQTAFKHAFSQYYHDYIS